MENGKANGSTCIYYGNGKLKEEKLYKKGKELSEKEFPLFKNPFVLTEVVCEKEDEWFTGREFESEEDPKFINDQEVSANFNASLSIFDGYPQDYRLSYSYPATHDENGEIIKLEVSSSQNGTFAADVKEAIQQLKFIPARKNNRNVGSSIIIKFNFRLEER